MSETNTTVTLGTFYTKLNERVSDYNARLLMHSAIVGSGLTRDDLERPLGNDDIKSICLELIKKGGPAFQVGKDMYTHVQ